MPVKTKTVSLKAKAPAKSKPKTTKTASTKKEPPKPLKKPVVKKPPAKKPAAQAKKPVKGAKAAPEKKTNPSKPAPGFKPSAWWDQASDGRRKAYVLRHPKGDYAKAFAKKFGLKYDEKTGLDEKTIAKVKVKGEKLKINMSEPPTPEPKAEEKETSSPSPQHQARRVEALRRKKAIHIAGSRLAAHRSKIVARLRSDDEVHAKQAEHALDDLKEEKPLTPERKKSLTHIATKMGKMALLALGAVALFTPLAPVAMHLGAEYLQWKFGDGFKPRKDDDDDSSADSKKKYAKLDDDSDADDEEGHEQKKAEVPKKEQNVGLRKDDKEESTSAEGMPTTLEGMYTDMCSWLLKQDPSKLAQKLKKDS